MSSQIVFLDDNEDLRHVMTSLIQMQMSIRCLGFSSLAELTANANEVLKSQVAILDIDLGNHHSSGIDAFQWLVDQGFVGQIFFLTGHGRSHPLVEEAGKAGVTIWEKPISTQEIIETIEIFFAAKTRKPGEG